MTMHSGRPASGPAAVPSARPRRVVVVGPPLRVPPLLAVRSPSTVLSFTADRDEVAGADVVVLTEPRACTVARVRRRAGNAVVVVVLRREAAGPRVTRLLAAGADACLLDPGAAELQRHLGDRLLPVDEQGAS